MPSTNPPDKLLAREAAEPNRKPAPVIHRARPYLVSLSHLRQMKPAHLCQMVAQSSQMAGSEHELGPHICDTRKRDPSTARRPPVGVRHQLKHLTLARNDPRQSIFGGPNTDQQHLARRHHAHPPRRKPSSSRRLRIVRERALRVARNHCEILQPGHDRDPQMGPGQRGAGPRIPPRHVRCRSRDLAVPDQTQQDFRQAPDGRPRRPRPVDRQDSPSCPASTIIADLASISFAGSPPRLGPDVGLHQSSSWGRQTPG